METTVLRCQMGCSHTVQLCTNYRKFSIVRAVLHCNAPCVAGPSNPMRAHGISTNLRRNLMFKRKNHYVFKSMVVLALHVSKCG